MAVLTDDQWIATFKACGSSPTEMAKATGISVRRIFSRRNVLASKLTVPLATGGNPFNYNPRARITGFEGFAISFSDCHWWPGISDTVAYLALLEVIRALGPSLKLLIANGDILDGAQISRFGPIGWCETPDVKAELDEVKYRMNQIARAAPNAQFWRTMGNHDLRYDSTLADRAAKFKGIQGFRLLDHLPAWRETMSLWINDHTVVKHRWNGGMNAGFNNVMKSGKSMVTGHDHILKVTPYIDYNGLRFAGQDGTLAEPGGPQFAYGEDNPSQACSGFLVLPFIKGGMLLEPEVCRVINGNAWFRREMVVQTAQEVPK